MTAVVRAKIVTVITKIDLNLSRNYSTVKTRDPVMGSI